MLCRALILLTALVSLSSAAAAQLAPHDTVRFVDERGLGVHGIVASIDSATLRLEADGPRVGSEFALAGISGVEVLRGRRRLGLAAVGIGAGVGAAAGALYGAAQDEGTSDIRLNAGARATIVGVLGAVAGTIVGAVVAFVPVNDWEPVKPVAAGPK